MAHTVGGVTSNYLGDLYGKGNLPYLLHKGGHLGAAFLLSLGISEGDIEEAIGGGIAALGAEIGAESLPSSLSREARGNIAKVGGSLAGLLAGAKKGTSIFTACNAIDHNFMWTIPLAARLTPRMLAALGLSGMTAYEVGQWLKDHPMLMDMLPKGIAWEDPGFIPEESKAEILTTPGHDMHPWQEGYQGFKEALPLTLVTPQAEDSLAYILTFDKKTDKLMLSKPLSMSEFKSDIFTKKIHWTSSVGTQQTYPVYQRGDIDWDMVRTSGKKDFIGKSNGQAAKAGFAPQLADGSFVTLHHIGQNAKGSIVEASTRYHGINSKNKGQIILHQQYGYGKKHPEHPVDHEIWKKEQAEYWKERLSNEHPD